MDPTCFLTHTLRAEPFGDSVCRVMAAALEAIDPQAAVARHLKLDDGVLTAGGSRIDLSRVGRIFLVGAGKAGLPMTRGLLNVLGGKIHAGKVIVKDEDDPLEGGIPGSIHVFHASHPIPDERGLAGTRSVLQMLAQTTADDLVICLLSGGASALLTSPADGIDLGDIQDLTALLLRSGANIFEINALRKHLDTVKGGGLARAAAPARVLSLILSDVVGDRLDVIASGPTAPDASTFAQALLIIEHYGLKDRCTPSILAHLERGIRGEIPETLKEGDSIFTRVEHILVGSNHLAARAGIDAAARLGFNTRLVTCAMSTEARQAGWILAGIARDISNGIENIARPACIIAGGETTVTVLGDGKGGRNQELALAAVSRLSGLPNMLLVALATDGGDGQTDAAGAVVSGQTFARALALGLLPMDHLTRNDSYSFFTALDDLIKTGPTLTNTNDLVFVFAL